MYCQLLKSTALPARHFSAVPARHFSAVLARRSIVGRNGDKVHKTKEEIEELARKAKYDAETVKGKVVNWAEEKESEVKEAAHKVHERTSGWTEASREKKRVSENAKGYKDLQDKGSHVEEEQQRPDDGL